MKKFKLSEYNSKIDFKDYEELSYKEILQAKCKECCCWDDDEVNLCNISSCPIWPAKNNNFKRNYSISDEERTRRSENMKNMINK